MQPKAKSWTCGSRTAFRSKSIALTLGHFLCPFTCGSPLQPSGPTGTVTSEPGMTCRRQAASIASMTKVAFFPMSEPGSAAPIAIVTASPRAWPSGLPGGLVHVAIDVFLQCHPEVLFSESVEAGRGGGRKREQKFKTFEILLMIQILHYLKDPIDYENYGLFLIMGHAGFLSSTVSLNPKP